MLRTRFLEWCAWLSFNHPWKVLLTFLLLTIISVFYALTSLDFITDQDQLMSDKLKYVQNYMKFKEDFRDLNFLYVVVEAGKNKEQAKKYARAVTEKLKKLPDIKTVLSQVDQRFFKKNLLMFFDESDLKKVLKSIEDMRKELNSWGGIKSLTQVLQYYNRKMSHKSRSQMTNLDFFALYFFLSELDLALAKDNNSSLFRRLISKKVKDYEDESYFYSDKVNKDLLYILILPVKDYKTLSVIQEPLKKIRKVIANTKKDFPGIQVGLTGQPVLQADEMQTTNDDMTYASILSIFGVALLFVIFLRNVIRPMLTVATLVVAILLTFGVTSFYPGHLNILSIVFAVMMIGLGIDFGIHFITRYHEELSKKNSVEQAIRQTLLTSGKGNITGTVTSSMAFYAALIVDFNGLSELGFIAGTGLLITLLAMLLLLPSFLVIHDRKKSWKDLHATSLIQFHFLQDILKHSKAVIIIGTGVAVISIVILLTKGISFDYNLLKLQADGLESVLYEKKIIKSTSESSWLSSYYIVKDLKTSDSIVKRLKTMDNVGKVESLRTFIPKNQTAKLSTISTIKRNIEMIKVPKNLQAINSKDVLVTINLLNSNILHYKDKSIKTTLLPFVNPGKEIPTLIKSIKLNLLENDPTVKLRLNQGQDKILKDFSRTFLFLDQSLSPDYITEKNLPTEVDSRFIGKHNQILVYAYPQYNIWDMNNLTKFITDLRKIDPDLVGSAITFYENSLLMTKGFQQTAIFALIIVFLLLYLDFKSLTYTLMALIPLFVGLLLLFGIMSLGNIHLNMANFFSIPILIGTGIDYGVHAVHRYKETLSPLIITKSTGSAIILTAFTTILGFGSLMIAQHKGVVSLGLIMTIGSFTAFLASLILLPSVLKHLNIKKDTL